MPRLIGATVVVGIAAFIIGTLFKLLLGATLLAGAISLIGRRIGKRQAGLADQNLQPVFNNANGSISARGPWNSAAFQKSATIVAIN